MLPAKIDQIVTLAKSPEYADLSHRILAVTAGDKDLFQASFSTVYRVLKAQNLMTARGPGGAHNGNSKAPVRKDLIAVGTVVTDGPPRRSVREELPHTAPALSQARNRISRTLESPRDLSLFRLWVRGRTASWAFLLAGSLSSTDSADASVASLFAGFAGTTNPSDFPSPFISALSPVAFSERSSGVGAALPLGPVDNEGISRFSRLEL